MARNKYNAPWSPKIYISESSIHGHGLIAKRNIKKGEVVFIIKGKIIKKKIHTREDALSGENWIGIGKNTWIDPVGFGRYINHSSTPSAGICGKVTVCALKNIKKGEEVTIDYSITEEQLMWEMEDYENGIYRGKVKSIQYLPQETFNKYLPFIPHYFQRVYRDHHGL